mmetsp:Transcript_47932/g.120967  ORF Transcript_47932/g.120967 Transcript_47932/m.120967 type:complete len:201 (+) Transcript_47932:447-1049(+)
MDLQAALRRHRLHGDIAPGGVGARPPHALAGLVAGGAGRPGGRARRRGRRGRGGRLPRPPRRRAGAGVPRHGAAECLLHHASLHARAWLQGRAHRGAARHAGALPRGADVAGGAAEGMRVAERGAGGAGGAVRAVPGGSAGRAGEGVPALRAGRAVPQVGAAPLPASQQFAAERAVGLRGGRRAPGTKGGALQGGARRAQ